VHVTYPQLLPLHEAPVVFGGTGQGVHDVPQVAGSVFFEQVAPLSQLWCIESQTTPHTPCIEQVAIVAPSVTGQGVHDVPQLAATPLLEQVAPLSQVWNPLLQLDVHVLIAHDAEPFAGTGHALPQAPQLALLEVVSTHVPLHELSVAGVHPSVHAPPEQSGVEPEHCVVQLPHVCGEVRFASHPSLGFDEQCAYPAVHAEGGTSHTPALQVTPGPLTFASAVQSCPHALQFFGSLERVTSHPFDGSWSQSAVPGAHVAGPPPSGEPPSGVPVSGLPVSGAPSTVVVSDMLPSLGPASSPDASGGTITPASTEASNDVPPPSLDVVTSGGGASGGAAPQAALPTDAQSAKSTGMGERRRAAVGFIPRTSAPTGARCVENEAPRRFSLPASRAPPPARCAPPRCRGKRDPIARSVKRIIPCLRPRNVWRAP